MRRYVVQLIMPSGFKFAASVYADPETGSKSFALVAFDEETESVRNALTWESEREAAEWIENLKHDDGSSFLSKWPGGWCIVPMLEPH